jgi:predicted nucleic acid-binding protein
MSEIDFIDSNILVYAYEPLQHTKQLKAQELVRRALKGEVITSTQVLSEFASTLLHKSRPLTPAETVLGMLESLSSIRVVVPDQEIVRRAVEAHERYGLHFWDGMIVAAAERGGCGKIWSEDMNAGQKYFGVVVENPFL